MPAPELALCKTPEERANRIKQLILANTSNFNRPKDVDKTAARIAAILYGFDKTVNMIDQEIATPARVGTAILDDLDILWTTAPAEIRAVLLAGMGVIFLSSFIRGFFVKSRDLITLLDQNEIKTSERKIHLAFKTLAEEEHEFDAGEHTIKLYSSEIIRKKDDYNKLYFAALFELNGKAMVIENVITNDDHIKKFTRLQNDRRSNDYDMDYQKLMEQIRVDKLNKITLTERLIEENTWANYFRWLRQSCVDLFKNQDPNAKPIEKRLPARQIAWFFMENALTQARHLFFGAAMYFWIIWFIATMTGGMAVGSEIAWGSPYIAFALPMILGALQYLGQAFLAYRKRRYSVTDQNNDLTAILTKAALAKKLEADALSVDKLKQSPMLDAIPDEPLETAGFMKRAWIKARDFFVGNYQIANIKNSPWESKIRIYVWVLIQFVFGFIVGFLCQWPLFDLLGNYFSVPMQFGNLAWFAVSLVCAFTFAAYGYRKASSDEGIRQKAIEGFEANTELCNEILNLEKLVLRARKAVAESRKKLGIKAKHIPRTIKLYDNLSFMVKFDTKDRPWNIVLWTAVKMIFNRIMMLVGPGGTGMLIVRLALMFVAILSGISTVAVIAVNTPSVIAALAIMSGLWAMIRLCQFLDNKNLERTNQALKEAANYPTYLNAEFNGLYAEWVQLDKLDKIPASIADPLAESPIVGTEGGQNLSTVSAMTAIFEEEEEEQDRDVVPLMPSTQPPIRRRRRAGDTPSDASSVTMSWQGDGLSSPLAAPRSHVAPAPTTNKSDPNHSPRDPHFWKKIKARPRNPNANQPQRPGGEDGLPHAQEAGHGIAAGGHR